MKKFIFGLALGLIISFSTVAYANGSIKVFISEFPFIFNGQPISLPSEYKVLDYNDRAYVPVRFIAENMAGTVLWDEETKTINIQYLVPSEPIYIDHRGLYPNLRVGNLEVVKVNEELRLKGNYTIFNTKEEHLIAYSLRLMDDSNHIIGRVPVGALLQPGEFGTFNEPILEIKGDVMNFKGIQMEIGIFDEVVGTQQASPNN